MFIPLVLSDEHVALQSSLHDLLAKRAGVRHTMDSDFGYNRELWQQLSGIGLHGLAIPEVYGGAGYGALETFLAFREMGRVLLASPFFASIGLAANVLLCAGTEDAKRAYLPRMAAGEMTASVAICEETGSWRLSDVRLDAVPDSGTFYLTGMKRFVIDGGSADTFFVIARSNNELSVFAVDREASGLWLEELTTFDLTRRQVDLHFDRTPATRVSLAGDVSDGVTQALEMATLALIAEQIGGAEELMSSALEYAKARYQFGRPIGSFQAVKHKLAEMAFDVERMVSAGWHAMQTFNSGSPDRSATLNLAKAFCSDAYFRIAAENIQIHGGIGYTWEHPAHLYFRRAKSSEQILGSPEQHREAMVARLVT